MQPTQRVWLAVLPQHDSDRLPALRRNKGKTDSLKKGNERKQKFLAAWSQSGSMKMSTEHIIYTECYQTDKSGNVFHPIVIPATSSFKKSQNPHKTNPLASKSERRE